MGEAWGFIWLMLLLKIPVAALLWLVWYSVRATPVPEETGEDDDGGLGRPRPHPSRPLPPSPRRRGPHGQPAPPAPARMRTPSGGRAPARDRAPR